MTLLESFLIGLPIGFIGGLHCVGMCGPLALALPINTNNKIKHLQSQFFYHIGRSLSYIAIGILLGTISTTISLFVLQQWISIVAGLLIIVTVIIGNQYIQNKIFLFKKLNEGVKTKISGLFGKLNSPFSFLKFGLLNGFLPCGLVFTAALAAMSTANIYNSITLMLGFGLGTIPLLGMLIFLRNSFPVKIKTFFSKWGNVFIIIIAILFILRGLNLGITYISPKINSTEEVDCCHPRERRK